MKSELPHHETAPADRVGFGEKVAFGVGGLAENTMHNAVNNMANPVFNVGLGVSPMMLGLATLIFRLWDAIANPVMGVISDRTQSRFGRRKPYIVGGAVFSGLFFAMIWLVPEGWSTTAYFWWFLLMSLVFYTAFTVFGVPYLALGYEMSPDYHERTRVMSFRTWFASAGGIAVQWLFWLTQRDAFENTVQGMRYVGIGVGVLLLLTGAAPGLFVKERVLTAAEKQANRDTIRFRAMFDVVGVRPFQFLLGALAVAVLGMFLVAILGFYINVYYVFGGDLKASSTLIGVSGSFYHLSCMASVPMIMWVSIKLGKRKTLMLFLGLAVLGTLLKWVCYTPHYPYLQLVVTALMAPGLSALWTLLASMNADVTDYDELEHGVRREGAFGAIYNWVLKLGFAICFLAAGAILQISGFDALLGGHQSAQTITILRFLYTAVPAAGLTLAVVIIAFYPITEERAYEIRQELQRRKGL